METKFYRAGEVAALLGIHESTLYRWLRRGQFLKPTIRMGARHWLKDDIHDWLDRLSAETKKDYKLRLVK